MKTKQKVAVCDIDGTVFRSSLFIELFKELVERNVFPQEAHKVYLQEYKKWQNRHGPYEEYVRHVVEKYHLHIKGTPSQTVTDIGKELLAFHQNRVYRYTRDMIRKLSRTHFLLAISHSPHFLVKPFCKNLGFDKVYALLYDIDEQGVFTGKIEYEDLIFSKDKILQRAIAKEGLTLKGSVGIGDTESDVAFLQMVEHPIAFNPNKALWKTATKNKWDIVVERKDMIYHM